MQMRRPDFQFAEEAVVALQAFAGTAAPMPIKYSPSSGSGRGSISAGHLTDPPPRQRACDRRAIRSADVQLDDERIAWTYMARVKR